MSEEKQIEEMAKDICRVKMNCNDVCSPISSCMALKYAYRAYKAGYRKQSKGEWKRDTSSKFLHRYNCTACNYRLIDEPTNFCPNCGARMKGGANQ